MDAVKREEVKIGILDGFIVAEMANKLIAKSLKVSRTINGNNGYGVVLSNEFVRLESDFRSFIASRRKQIASFTANMTEKLYVCCFFALLPLLKISAVQVYYHHRFLFLIARVQKRFPIRCHINLY